MDYQDSPAEIAAAGAADYRDAVLPVDPSGPLYGVVAQGLALGAPLTLMNSRTPWNALWDCGQMDAAECRLMLTDTWGVTDEDHWLAVINRLVDGEYGAGEAYWAVRARTRARRRLGLRVVDEATWVAEIETIFADSEQQRFVAPITAAIDEVNRAETIMRAAHVLDIDEQVAHCDAYDYTRAVSVARWGVRSGWGTPFTVANVAVAVARRAALDYTSWRDYALGWDAGRIVTYPDTWGRAFVPSIRAVRSLLDSPVSPWNNLPFPDPEDAEPSDAEPSDAEPTDPGPSPDGASDPGS
ncbi:DUF1266 domain-containing protein [Gordonia crocea]|uniref:DUF1266 domain-containing protein n=1 Tax=Gordonia crocea TaxID=589162 RepID=A0A7I9V156_9ACTN|nr:DUF1266 domain-containing protein [Gordonia crocea]GED99135.1 hypothetical protein nbrc107697_31740 [Gordonia crocea]